MYVLNGTQATLSVVPFTATGTAVAVDYYRYPQPPFEIVLRDSARGSQTAVHESPQCALHGIPCDVECSGSTDRLSVQQLEVTFGGLVTRQAPVILALNERAAVSLRWIATVTQVNAASFLPEMFVEVLDETGSVFTVVQTVDVSVSVSALEYEGTLLMTTVSGQMSLPVPNAPVVALGSVSFTASSGSLAPAVKQLTFVVCRAQASVILSSVTVRVSFRFPHSSLEEQQPLTCISGSSEGPSTRVDACTVACDVPLMDAGGDIRIASMNAEVIHGTSTLPPRHAPTVAISGRVAINAANTSLTECIPITLIDKVGSQLCRFPSWVVTGSSVRWMTATAPVGAPVIHAIVDTPCGWLICGVPPQETLRLGSGTLVVNVSIQGTLLNGSSFTADSPQASLAWVLDTSCLDRSAMLQGSISAQSLAQRDVVLTPRTKDPSPNASAVSAFVDNSTCAVQQLNGTLVRLQLLTCTPSLSVPQLGDVFLSDVVIVLSDGYAYKLSLLRQQLETPLPRVLSVTGCAVDCFPIAAGCSLKSDAPITIGGMNFNTSHSVSFEFPDNPSSVPCVVLTVVSNTTMVCTMSSGYGSAGVAVVSLGGTVLHRSEPLLWFVASAAGNCGMGDNGMLCSGHGECDPNLGSCVCYRSSTEGYWSGKDCSLCQQRYNDSDKCMTPCPANSDNVVCSGKGYCSQGQCWCGTSWTSSACDGVCPGSGSPCSGHGLCDSQSGRCSCVDDAASGHFSGTGCDECVDGYSGEDCLAVCPRSSTGAVCSGNGACVDGRCYCDGEHCGLLCEKLKSDNHCDGCPLPGLYGPLCDKMCPGGTASNPCSGHGSCDGGLLGSGKCICNDGYGTAGCGVACPVSSDGLICGGRGKCAAVSAQCVCPHLAAGPACTVDCPVVNHAVCSGHGQCDEGALGTGQCACLPGYSGTFCNITCSGPAIPCNGRGQCGSSGRCECYRDPVLGHWDGVDCDTCAYPYAGVDCAGLCATTINGTACSGHGTCGNTLMCQCHGDAQRGFWGGAACDSCAEGYFGSNCNLECAGGACSPCNFHGTCSSGVRGTGSCSCFHNASHGFWAPSDCSECVATYFGSACSRQCPMMNGIACVNGRCADGLSGDGLCSCNTGFAPDASGHCLECQTGYYGTSCARCPSSNDEPCSRRGVCMDGRSGNGTCRCDLGYTGSTCNITCGVVGGRLCGRGECVANNTCLCESGFTVANGTCSVCIDGLFGHDCSMQCPACVHGVCNSDGLCNCDSGYWGLLCDALCPRGGADNVCSGHGNCDPLTGQCKCFQSLSLGFYGGAACSTCVAEYNSPSCTVPCPTYNGSICYGRGRCFNGSCSDCEVLPREMNLITLRCGYACQLYDADCAPNSCPLGRYGPGCLSVCPGATASNASTTCMQRGLCTMNGTCVCSFGYFGADCSGSCPVTKVGICNQRGVCRSGACSCNDGWLGAACEGECPGGYASPCSGHGVCNSTTGKCTCSYGYYGAACDLECPGGAHNPCSGNGVCSPVGTCSCWADQIKGYFSGISCAQCANEMSGPRCVTSCPRTRGTVATTSTRPCVCLPQFIGSECALRCPQGSGGASDVCNGRGRCQLSSNGLRAVCSCDPGFFGSACDVVCSAKHCEDVMGYYRAQCSPDSGQCECRDNALGHWQGPRCSKCMEGYWGPECSAACTCNNRGTCDSTNAKCSCFADVVKGHWTGSDCSKCVVGFTGSDCNMIEVKLATAAPALLVAKPSQSVVVPALSTFLASRSLLIIQDTSDLKLLRSYSLSDRGALQVTAQYSVAFPVVALQALNRSHIMALMTGGYRALLNGDSVTAVPRHSAFRTLSSTSSLSIVMHQTICTLTVPLDSLPVRDASLDCGTPLVINGLTSNLTRVNWADASDAFDVVVIAGDSTAMVDDLFSAVYPNFAVVWWSTALGSSVAFVVNPYRSLRSSIVECVLREGTLAIWCLTYSAQSQAVHLVSMTATGDVPGQATLGVVEGAVVVTAFRCSEALDICVVAYNSIGRDSIICMFAPSTLRIISVASAEVNFRVTAIEVGEDQRVLTLVLENTISRKLATYNLFGVLRVSPKVIDAIGGAILTVVGIGFPVQNSSDVMCKLSGALLPAQVLNSSHLTCQSQASLLGSAACLADPVEIVIGTTNRSSGATTVGVYRPVSAVLASAVTSEGQDGYGSSDAPAMIVVQGFGFVSSDAAKCRLVALDGAERYRTSNVTFVNSTMILCEQPPTSPSDTPTFVEYSHDGVVFGKSSRVPFTIVGPLAHFAATVDGSVVVAGEVSHLPTIHVFTTDAFGNRRLMLDDRRYTVRCSSMPPTEIAAGNEERLAFADTSDLQSMSFDQGEARFNVALLRPPSGLQTLYFYSPQDSKLFATLLITIVSGPPVALSVARHASWVAGVRSSAALQPSPVVRTIDAAGNLAAPNATVAKATVSTLTLGPSGEITTGTSQQYSTLTSDGSFVFSDLQPRTVFGALGQVTFTVGELPPLVIALPAERCDGNEYGVEGTGVCSTCPAHGLCNGSPHVDVEPGFYRAARDATEFYPCDPPAACLGGSNCAPLYSGVLCSRCDAGYGKSGKECAPCYSTATNWLVISALLFALVVLMSYLSVFSMPVRCVDDASHHSARKEPNPASIVVKIAVSHFQMLSLVPIQTIAAPSFLSAYFATSGAVSRININLSFLSCEVYQDSVTAMKATFLLVPVLIGTFAIISFVVAQYLLWRQAGKGLLGEEYEVVPGTALSTSAQLHVAKSLARNPTEFNDVVKSHNQLLDEMDLVTLPPRNDENAAADGVTRNERFLNMWMVSVLVILFFLYPTIVDKATVPLRCKAIDIGKGQRIMVLQDDASVECTGSSFVSAQTTAWGGLLGFGLAVPVLNIVLVKVVQWLTCRGSMQIAQSVFFFSTGGYKSEVWYWESISLARKFVLTLATGILPDVSLKLIVSTMIMLASVLLNVTAKPWREKLLSTTEAVSLGCTAITFGLFELFILVGGNANGGSKSGQAMLLLACIAAVNIVAALVLLYAFAVTSRRSILILAARKDWIGSMFRALRDLLTESSIISGGHNSLKAKVEHLRQRRQETLPRDAVLDEAITIVAQLVERGADHQHQLPVTDDGGCAVTPCMPSVVEPGAVELIPLSRVVSDRRASAVLDLFANDDAILVQFKIQPVRIEGAPLSEPSRPLLAPLGSERTRRRSHTATTVTFSPEHTPHFNPLVALPRPAPTTTEKRSQLPARSLLDVNKGPNSDPTSTRIERLQRICKKLDMLLLSRSFVAVRIASVPTRNNNGAEERYLLSLVEEQFATEKDFIEELRVYVQQQPTFRLQEVQSLS